MCKIHICGAVAWVLLASVGGCSAQANRANEEAPDERDTSAPPTPSGVPDAAAADAASPDAAPRMDASSPSDAGTDSAVSSDAGSTRVGGCDVVGLYLEPQTQLYWRYRADGTWQTASSIGALDMAPRSTGNWSLSGDTLTTDDIGSPSPNACPASQIGSYTVSFDAACSVMRWSLIADPCAGRANYYDTRPRTRQ